MVSFLLCSISSYDTRPYVHASKGFLDAIKDVRYFSFLGKNSRALETNAPKCTHIPVPALKAFFLEHAWDEQS